MAKLTNPKPIESISDGALDSEAKRFGKQLARAPKRRIKIPKDPLNPKETMIRVVLNGYQFNIPLGKEVELPVPIIEILERSGRY